VTPGFRSGVAERHRSSVARIVNGGSPGNGSGVAMEAFPASGA